VNGIFHAADDRPCRIMDTSYLELYNSAFLAVQLNDFQINSAALVSG